MSLKPNSQVTISKNSPEEDFKLLCVRINVLKVQSHQCFNRAIRSGSRCHRRPTLSPALLDGCCSCPSSACPSSCVGSWEEKARWEWEQQKPPIWRWRFGWSLLWKGLVMSKWCWKVAGWAVCCVSSGCPYERTSSGPARPAAEPAPAAAWAAGDPPEAKTNKKLSEPRQMWWQGRFLTCESVITFTAFLLFTEEVEDWLRRGAGFDFSHLLLN